jgi:uncharacterized protein
MQQQISFVTLGVADLARSRAFYTGGFGWRPVFENPQIIFYQMNGLVLGTFDLDALAEDIGHPVTPGLNSATVAHNVASREAVDAAIAALLAAGGTLLRAADEPPHGGYRGYVADPDRHAWEIAWTPGIRIGADGRVTFGTA